MIDFVELFTPIWLDLFGKRIRRARFGEYIRLIPLAEKIDQALDRQEVRSMATLINEYLTIAGLNADGLSGEHLLVAYYKLKEFNQWPRWIYAFQVERGPEPKPMPYDYKNRSIAWVIHKLASRYGWTRDYIFGLEVEEVGAYLQEILISEFDEYERARVLSEVSYSYDKAAKVSRLIPMPRPEWMTPKIEPKPIRINRAALPVGLIIKGDDGTIH